MPVVPVEKAVYTRHVARTPEEEKHSEGKLRLDFAYKFIDSVRGFLTYPSGVSGSKKGTPPPAPPEGTKEAPKEVGKYTEADIPAYHEEAIDELLGFLGAYRSNLDEHDIASELLEYAGKSRGHKFVYLPKDVMESKYDALGFEIGKTGYISEGLGIKRPNVVAHELSGMIRHDLDPTFDHAHEHRMGRFLYDEETGDGGAALKKAALESAKAIKEMLNRRKI